MIQTVTLKSETQYGDRVPPEPIGNLLRETPAVVQQAIRMAFLGRSTARGRQPEWLKAMSDVRVVDLRGGDHTMVRFDAPRFGEAAGKVYDQLELWPTGRPSPEDTGFDVLGDILCDLSQDDSDSDRFDHQLLRGLTAFSNVVNGYFQEMFITGGRYPKEHPAILNERTIATAREFYSTTPSPTAARVVGKLDMVCISSQSFGLELKDGAKVRGALAAGQIVELRGLLGERVVVLGEAVFRTSGNLLRIDGESIRPAGDESFVWSRIPRPSMRALDVGKLRRRQGPRSGVSAVIGHWPGDESDEEIHAALRELS